MIFIKYDEYGNISQTQNITESIGQNSLKANTLYIAFPNVVKSYISMIKEYKCYITFERSDGIKISDLPCTPVSKTIDGIEYFGYLYSFSSKQVTACAGSLIVSPRLFSINNDGEETIAVIGANQTLSVSPSVVESEVVSNLSEAEKNALVDMIQNQHIMWLEKKYNNYSAIEVFTSLLENSMSDGIYVSFDRKRLFIYERTTESICFGEFIKNGIVKNETGIYKYDNEENFEYIKIDDLKTGNLSDLPFTANSIVEALNKIIDGTEQVGNAISADYAETSYNTYRDSEDNLIATYYASKSALSQANKEIANLKEVLYGYVLDTADVEIEKDIPYTTTIGSNTYNLVDNAYGLIKEIRGNTIVDDEYGVFENLEYEGLNIVGENLLNPNNFIPRTYIQDGQLKTETTDGWITSEIIPFNNSVSFNFNSKQIRYMLLDSNKIYIDGTYQLLTSASGTISNVDAKYIQVSFRIDDEKNIMLVKGSTAPTTFKPYKNPIYILNNLSEFSIILRSVGSAKDKIVITKNTDNEYYTATKITNIGLVDLGTLSWTYVESWNGKNLFYTKLTNAKFIRDTNLSLITGGYTHHGAIPPVDETYRYNNQYISATENTLGIVDTYYTNLTDFVGHVSGIELQYELATPTTEVISTTLTDSDVMPLLELGGSVDIDRYLNAAQGSTVVEMVYRLSNTGV